MTIYLTFLDKQKFTQQLVDTPSFQAKHKISVNNPTQTHYTVQGVQSYAPDQLKALKEREDRTMLGKEGSYAPLKVVLLSDQVIEFEQKDPNIPSKRNQLKIKQSPKQKVKERPQSAKPAKSKINARNAVSANNQAIVKLEKQVAKRNSLQRKLQKMSQKYKEYFKDVDLKEGLKIKKKKEESQMSKDQKLEQIEDHYSQQDNKTQTMQKQSASTKFDKKSSSTRPLTAKNSSKGTKKQQKQTKKEDKQKQKTIKQSNFQSDNDVQDVDESRNISLDLGFDLVMRSTTFSEKLGSAINQIFK